MELYAHLHKYAHYSILYETKLAAVMTPEMSVRIYQARRRNIPENCQFHTYRHQENFDSHQSKFN
jgi:hypothetical protein